MNFKSTPYYHVTYLESCFLLCARGMAGLCKFSTVKTSLPTNSYSTKTVIPEDGKKVAYLSSNARWWCLTFLQLVWCYYSISRWPWLHFLLVLPLRKSIWEHCNGFPHRTFSEQSKNSKSEKVYYYMNFLGITCHQVELWCRERRQGLSKVLTRLLFVLSFHLWGFIRK